MSLSWRTVNCKTEYSLEKSMLYIWWDMKDVLYFELLKPGETVMS